jgi:hypothetical protein
VRLAHASLFSLSPFSSSLLQNANRLKVQGHVLYSYEVFCQGILYLSSKKAKNIYGKGLFLVSSIRENGDSKEGKIKNLSTRQSPFLIHLLQFLWDFQQGVYMILGLRCRQGYPSRFKISCPY